MKFDAAAFSAYFAWPRRAPGRRPPQPTQPEHGATTRHLQGLHRVHDTGGHALGQYADIDAIDTSELIYIGFISLPFQEDMRSRGRDGIISNRLP